MHQAGQSTIDENDIIGSRGMVKHDLKSRAMKKLENILIVNDEDSVRRVLYKKLSGEGYKCILSTNAEQAFDEMRKSTVGLVILDMKLLGKSGIELLPEIKGAYPETQVLIATDIDILDIVIRYLVKYNYIVLGAKLPLWVRRQPG